MEEGFKASPPSLSCSARKHVLLRVIITNAKHHILSEYFSDYTHSLLGIGQTLHQERRRYWPKNRNLHHSGRTKYLIRDVEGCSQPHAVHLLLIMSSAAVGKVTAHGKTTQKRSTFFLIHTSSVRNSSDLKLLFTYWTLSIAIETWCERIILTTTVFPPQQVADALSLSVTCRHLAFRMTMALMQVNELVVILVFLTHQVVILSL